MKDLFDNVLPETLSILSRNPIFIALYNVVTTYFILASNLDLNIILPYHYNYLLCCVHSF